MKTFKSFVAEAKPNAKPKAKGEADFVAAHEIEVVDPENQETEGSAKVTTKDGSGKRKADRLDNKQAMGEEVEELDEISQKLAIKAYAKRSGTMSHNDPVARKKEDSAYERIGKRWGKKGQQKADAAADKYQSEEVELDEEQLIEMDAKNLPFTPDKPKKNPPAKAGKYGQGPSTAKHLAQQGMKKTLRQMKKSMQEADFSKKETKMAHTIGKEFEKKGVGDETKGGPYAVASAMVRDKPEAAKKAYKTIQSKMKEEVDADILFKLYDDLNEENQAVFMEQLETDAEGLLEFAKSLMEE